MTEAPCLSGLHHLSERRPVCRSTCGRSWFCRHVSCRRNQDRRLRADKNSRDLAGCCRRSHLADRGSVHQCSGHLATKCGMFEGFQSVGASAPIMHIAKIELSANFWNVRALSRSAFLGVREIHVFFHRRQRHCDLFLPSRSSSTATALFRCLNCDMPMYRSPPTETIRSPT